LAQFFILHHAPAEYHTGIRATEHPSRLQLGEKRLNLRRTAPDHPGEDEWKDGAKGNLPAILVAIHWSG
jgi:hypothetical protein